MLSRLFPGLVLLCLGLFLVFVLIPMGIRAPGYVQPNSLSPQDLPRLLAWVVVAVSLCIIFAGIFVGGQEGLSLGAMSPLRGIVFIAAFAGLLLLLPVLGTALTVFLFVFGLLLFKSRLGPLRSLVLSILFSSTVHVLFIEIARIPLPNRLPDLF
ncbi:tripartite tricarboxylate transporter TctB family protein [Roseovarius sp. SK2]|jgi:hypothetical protein|uniref:tripartite tricarboxylate transporter TctB family protein n=1 Tax=Roseovarius TaxID=74030 RepID=UPI000CDE15DC|nr:MULTISPECIES: tripartite tricarboxylate transporter TctB family protein [Roseovarius]MDD9726938.1 tripartite tricarboxylate transporter TctB family protein [Roseovarius sp. SK2]